VSLKRVPAFKLHGNQLIEWCDLRWRILRTRPLEGRCAAHPRQQWGARPWGAGRDGVLLSVICVSPSRRLNERTILHYWADEDVTVCGWSIGES
jgi:hypothetical protein